MNYNKHQSVKLNELYKIKSYQGADPQKAKIIFVGRDPNWSENIENIPLFSHVNDYLVDGVSFWKAHGVHHPFLLKEYIGDGKRYHMTFSKLLIDSNFSEMISFVELIGFPTCGIANKDRKLFEKHLLSNENEQHLVELDNLLSDVNKKFFIAWGLLNDFKLINKQTGLFNQLLKINKNLLNINKLNQIDNFFVHKHFSDSISNDTIFNISLNVKKFLQNK